MKTRTKRLASILLALGMVLSLASCGGSETGENSAAPAASSEEAGAGSSADGAEAPVAGDIVFQTWTTEIKEVVDLQTEAMKEIYPDLNIKMELFSYDDYWQKLPIAIASGAGPDMYLMTRPNFEVFANAGQAADITSYMTSTEALKKNASEVDPALIETYQLDGKQKFTVTLGLSFFKGQFGTQWGLLMAASVMVVLPILLLFVVAQKQFIQGIVVSGVKG